MNQEHTYIYCIHCEQVYTEGEEIRIHIEATRHSPPDQYDLCPYCGALDEDNTEATPEQIEYSLNN